MLCLFKQLLLIVDHLTKLTCYLRAKLCLEVEEFLWVIGTIVGLGVIVVVGTFFYGSYTHMGSSL